MVLSQVTAARLRRWRKPEKTLEVTMSDAPVRPTDAQSADIVEESLIEEVSIDGMCGVY